MGAVCDNKRAKAEGKIAAGCSVLPEGTGIENWKLCQVEEGSAVLTAETQAGNFVKVVTGTEWVEVWEGKGKDEII